MKILLCCQTVALVESESAVSKEVASYMLNVSFCFSSEVISVVFLSYFLSRKGNSHTLHVVDLSHIKLFSLNKQCF